MTRKLALLFPGQGSQYIGMGSDIAEAFPETRILFEQVDDICQKPISKLCFHGPLDALTLTVNLQPAVTVVSLACLAALKSCGVTPQVSAGHSLGEYAALAAAEGISASDALALVNRRGELMHRESLEHPGAMAALIGLPIEKVEKIVAEACEEEILGVANHNTADQIVVTGQEAAVSRAIALAKKEGGKAVPLRVSGAWHCALMEKAVPDFRRFMDSIAFSSPKTRVLFNATAAGEDDPDSIKDIMARQLVSPVRWYDIVQTMLADGVNLFLEVGPKKVLSGLVKKIIPPQSPASVFNVEDMKSLRLFLETMA